MHTDRRRRPRRLLADALVDLRRAGVTHLALEEPPGFGAFMRPMNALQASYRAQTLLLARLLGIKIVPVDGQGDLDGRNGIMARGLDRILSENPRAKIVMVVGAYHLEPDDGWPIQARLRARGVAAVDAEGWFWARTPSAAAIREAGLARRTFYLPLEAASPDEYDGLLHAPYARLLTPVPRPWAAAKRWARALAYRWASAKRA